MWKAKAQEIARKLARGTVADVKQEPENSLTSSPEQAYMYARFRRNQEFLNNDPEFRALLEKSDSWDEHDKIKFAEFITQLGVASENTD